MGIMPESSMKGVVFETVRQLHRLTALRPLPDRVSIYFHELERSQWTQFADCMNFFFEQGYRSTSIGEFLHLEGDDKRLLITFDDNYAGWHEALPLLDKLGVQATFYMNTAPLRDKASASSIQAYFDRIAYDGDRRTLSSNDVREIRSAGHVIGAHTHSHVDLSTLPRDAWESEILGNKRILEDILGGEVDHFSYPFGMRRYFNDELRAYCLMNGFRTIAAGIPGMLYQNPMEPADLQRTRWHFTNTLERNVDDICIDGRVFATVTGRSPVG
ncbi:MAG: polysaccharide deacetylase family protein [Hyphomicrobiaceae bacterium]|nr:polysaccharide deacetylase family protein [Hyphomicrobiaceae bacterium]